MTRHRPGFALTAVIACLAVLEITVIALITVAMRTRIAVENTTTLGATRVAAESAIRKAIAGWDEAIIMFPAPGSRFAVPWATDSIGDILQSVEAERLFRGVYLLRGTGWAGAAAGVGIRASASATVTSIPSDELWLDFHAAIVSGSDFALLAGAAVDATSGTSPVSPMQPADCQNFGPAPPYPTGSARPAIAFGGAANLATPPGTSITGSPAVLTAAARASPADFLRLGRLPIADIGVIADHVVSGTISIAPKSLAGACDTAALHNWGEPGSRTDPCFDWLPLIYATGDLSITSGQGQGMLVVDGDLTLGSGVRFIGPILVTGRIDAPDVELHGSLRVGGPGSSVGGLIRFDECALTRAFTRARAMRKVYRFSDRLWLPPF